MQNNYTDWLSWAFPPMTPEQAQAEYDAIKPEDCVPLTKDEIERMVAYAKKRRPTCQRKQNGSKKC